MKCTSDNTLQVYGSGPNTFAIFINFLLHILSHISSWLSSSFFYTLLFLLSWFSNLTRLGFVLFSSTSSSFWPLDLQKFKCLNCCFTYFCHWDVQFTYLSCLDFWSSFLLQSLPFLLSFVPPLALALSDSLVCPFAVFF